MTPTAVVAKADAREQFSQLLERHRGIVLKVASTYCRAPWDRDDLAQEIAAQLWRAFPSFGAPRHTATNEKGGRRAALLALGTWRALPPRNLSEPSC